MAFKIIARHKDWLAGSTITESVSPENVRRFTATIRGWRNWKLREFKQPPTPAELFGLIEYMRRIQNRIDKGDESVFAEPPGF